jgi:hypothetical protein
MTGVQFLVGYWNYSLLPCPEVLGSTQLIVWGLDAFSVSKCEWSRKDSHIVMKVTLSYVL